MNTAYVQYNRVIWKKKNVISIYQRQRQNLYMINFPCLSINPSTINATCCSQV